MGGKTKIYVDFLTNCAVAWFTAGVVGPVFMRQISGEAFSSSLLSLIACFFTLEMAKSFQKND
jgi:hypothetical protein